MKSIGIGDIVEMDGQQVRVRIVLGGGEFNVAPVGNPGLWIVAKLDGDKLTDAMAKVAPVVVPPVVVPAVEVKKPEPEVAEAPAEKKK